MEKNSCFNLKEALAFFKDGRVSYTLFLLLLIFSLTVTSSIAWLTSNRQLASNDLGMGLEVDDTIANYKAYMYDLENGAGTDKVPGSNGEELNISNLVLNQYDTIFRVNNKYTPAFAKISITRIESMPETGTVHLTISRNAEAAESDKISAFASNIIRFTAIIDKSKEDVGITDADELYGYINNETTFKEVETYRGNGRAESQTFVTYESEGTGRTYQISETITVSLEYSASDWYTDSYGHKTLNVYLYMTYDTELIKFYKQDNESGNLSLIDTSIIFKNDFDRVRVSYS